MDAVAPRRVIVVDASSAMRETVKLVLGDAYDVIAVADVELFDRRAFQPPPDLLVVGPNDLVLSQIDLLPRGVPILWLAPTSGWMPPSGGTASRVLSRAFVPAELRREAEKLLGEARCHLDLLSSHAGRLEQPFLSGQAATVARRAAETPLPVLIWGGRGTGRTGLARSIHQFGSRGAFIAAAARTLDLSAPPPPPSHGYNTLFVDRIEQLPEPAQQRLLGLIDPGGMVSFGDGPPVRLIAGTELAPDELLVRPGFSLELYYRLAVLIIEIVPLRERPQDVPSLACRIGEELARRLGVASVRFTDAALERLSNHLWFGDIVELESVLARTLAIARRDTIDAPDLRFDLPEFRHTPREPSLYRAAPPAGEAAPRRNALELVIGELAHELKNPMVSIKTFAQHLRRMGFRGADEEQVAKLAGDAVDQMDQAVENLIQFTRFDEPVRERVTVAAVLGPAVANLAQLLKPRSRRVEYRPPSEHVVSVDRAQITYGLTNLFRALARGLGDTGRLTIGCNEQGHVVVELPSSYDPSEARLASLLASAAPESLPLPATLAKQIIERNGGAVVFDAKSHPPTVTVRLPEADDQEVPLASHEQTPCSHR